MRFLVVYFSFSGNNRLLATLLARRLDCESCAVVDEGRRTTFTILLDMIFRRMPRLQALEKNLGNYEHIVFVAPVWNYRLANPMAALLQREREHIASYSFITLCGNARAGQRQSLEDQLIRLTGKQPRTVQELRVSALLADKGLDAKLVASYRVAGSDLVFFDRRIAEFVTQVRATA